MKRFLLALALLIGWGGIASDVEAQACDEKCEARYNQEGWLEGHGCYFGTQGFDCVATHYTCSIATTGCGGETEEDFAVETAGAAFDNGYLTDESGVSFFVLVPCLKGGSSPLFISLETFERLTLDAFRSGSLAEQDGPSR